MAISRTLLAEIIGKRTLKAYDSKKLAKEIAAYLLDESRVNELDSLIRDLIEYRAGQGILEINVDKAHEINDQIRNEITKLAKTSRSGITQVITNENQDDSLIGGVRLNLSGKLLDLSVRAKLNQFKQLTNEGKV